mmetsp:Transcript_17991/g.55064  ORF Transcript_17991/g.55064 Transcript_17991/m.55064 type:complete len:443 (+) Transcript_17991:1171-2499(+)
MKIKAIAHSARRQRGAQQRNLEPGLHPFAEAREYQRAVVAAKLDRMMAKPFVCALDAHRDGVTCLACPRYEGAIARAASGSGDGELKVWDLASRGCAWHVEDAHSFARGVSFTKTGDHFLSCGDRSVKRWDPTSAATDVVATWTTGGTLNDVDASYVDDAGFATASAEGVVEVWDAARSKALRAYSWGSAASYRARWNPAEPTSLASCSRDRSLVLYDVRRREPVRRLVLTSKANALAWNPRDPMSLLVGREDAKAAIFDARRLDVPRCLYEDHVAPLTDVSFAPTGLEFATASSDKTLRVFKVRGDGVGRSRDVYHTHRMQALTAVRYSPDAAFLLSASDDANVRLWKAHASTRLGGPLHPSEREALDYRRALLKKHKHVDEVRRILKSRHLPKLVKKLKLKAALQKDKARRKLSNTIQHTTPGSTPTTAARETAVLTELE